MIFRLLYVALIGLVASLVSKNLHVGIDFYHFWVVGAARAHTEKPLRSPYADAEEYAAVVNAEADRIWSRYLTREEIQWVEKNPEQLPRVIEGLAKKHGEAQLHDLRENSRFLLINMRRRALDLTGTPLLYALCTALPGNYDTAYELWAWLLIAAFLLASVLLVRTLGLPWEQVLLCAAGLLMIMRPLNTDVRVGNVNAMHLLVAAVGLFAAAVPLRRAQDDRTRVRWGAVVLAAAAAYLLLKPTFAFAAFALAGHVALVLGRGLFVRALVPAAIATLALAAFPCVLFGAPLVWFDWLGYIGQDSEKLAYGIEKSNLSAPLHLQTWMPAVPLAAWSALLGALLIASLAYLLRSAPGASFAAKLRAMLSAIARDPFAAASLGICITFATSPLVWGHYLTVFLIPLVWYAGWELKLRSTRRAWTHGTLFFCSALLYSGTIATVGTAFGVSENDGNLRAIAAFAWVPLWLVLLAWIRERLHDEPTADAGSSSSIPLPPSSRSAGNPAPSSARA